MAEVMFDVVEEILLRVDADDLLRCKSVCKLWYSLISSPYFVKSHLNLTNKNNHGPSRRTRITLPNTRNNLNRIVGSSNGLVCIFINLTQFLVTNPITREVKNLANPDGLLNKTRWNLCWGFGYDSSIDDYKIVLGNNIGNLRTRFYLLTLKSNLWRLLGDFNCSLNGLSKGILCNGALHWFMNDLNANNIFSKIIFSFDLSREEFQEIPQPDDTRYVRRFISDRLGITQECLCIYTTDYSPTWVMESYNVKQSWKRLPVVPNMKYDLRHSLNCISPYTSWSLSDDKDDESSWGQLYVGDPVFVKSLVSPHLNEKQKKIRRPKINKASVRRVSTFDVISRSFRFSYGILYRKRKRKRRSTRNHKGHTSAPRTSAEV